MFFCFRMACFSKGGGVPFLDVLTVRALLFWECILGSRDFWQTSIGLNYRIYLESYSESLHQLRHIPSTRGIGLRGER